MNIAANQVKDCGLAHCGDRAFFDTLENLRRVGIRCIGAGENLGQAMQTEVESATGIRFGIVSWEQIEQRAVFTLIYEPCIAVLDEQNILGAVSAARRISDAVIFIPH